MEISKSEAAKIMRAQSGKIFTVSFIKKDGTLRQMTCRLGVKAHWKTPDGSGRKYDPADHGLICVFDMSKGEYRNINVNTLQSLTADGVTYTVT